MPAKGVRSAYCPDHGRSVRAKRGCSSSLSTSRFPNSRPLRCGPAPLSPLFGRASADGAEPELSRDSGRAAVKRRLLAKVVDSPKKEPAVVKHLPCELL